MITIIASFSVKPESADKFTKAALDVTRETRKEKGCLSYKVLKSEREKGQYTFIEEWLNNTAIEQHNASAHFSKFLSEIRPLTTAEIQIERYTKIPSVFF